MISIITPVYNAEKYIGTTVRSIKEQDYADWELILVDDCSTDATPTVCRQLAASDPRIRYVRQDKNSGPAAARNKGLDLATGEWLAFIDSDDTVERNFLSRLHNAAIKHCADVVWCNFFEDFPSRGTSIACRHNLPTETALDSRRALTCFLTEQTGLGSMWNKLYRREFVERFGIRLNTERYHGEDWEFNMTVFRHEPRIVPIDDVLYHYIRQNTDSVVSCYRPFDYATFCHSHALKKQLAEDFLLDYDAAFANGHFLYMVISLLMTLVRSHYANKHREFKRIAEDATFRNIISSRELSTSMLTLRYKVYFALLKLRIYRLCFLLMAK